MTEYLSTWLPDCLDFSGPDGEVKRWTNQLPFEMVGIICESDSQRLLIGRHVRAVRPRAGPCLRFVVRSRRKRNSFVVGLRIRGLGRVAAFLRRRLALARRPLGTA